jgi:hypothetical protein
MRSEVQRHEHTESIISVSIDSVTRGNSSKEFLALPDDRGLETVA